MRPVVYLACVVVGLASTSCASGANAGASTTGRPPSTAAGTDTASTGASSTAPGASENLAVTDAVRAQLVAAGAALDNLTVADYTGLRAGETYYAYDPVTKTYWAGAGLVASSNSTPAQVASQDDGAYLLFERPAGNRWKAYAVGMAGVEGGTCPVSVPAQVLRLWGWAAGSCRPRTIL